MALHDDRNTVVGVSQGRVVNMLHASGFCGINGGFVMLCAAGGNGGVRDQKKLFRVRERGKEGLGVGVVSMADFDTGLSDSVGGSRGVVQGYSNVARCGSRIFFVKLVQPEGMKLKLFGVTHLVRVAAIL